MAPSEDTWADLLERPPTMVCAGRAASSCRGVRRPRHAVLGPNVFAISVRRDTIVNGDVTEEAEETIEALIAHIDDELQSVELADTGLERDAAGDTQPTPSMAVADGAGRTIRSILAAEFTIAPARVGSFLREGDLVAKLNTAVTAIESSEEMVQTEDYSHIVFVDQANRYRLSETAAQLTDRSVRPVVGLGCGTAAVVAAAVLQVSSLVYYELAVFVGGVIGVVALASLLLHGRDSPPVSAATSGVRAGVDTIAAVSLLVWAMALATSVTAWG